MSASIKRGLGSSADGFHARRRISTNIALWMFAEKRSIVADYYRSLQQEFKIMSFFLT